VDRCYRIENRRGELRWIRERSFAVKDGSGHMLHLMGLAQDTTAARRAEEDRLSLEMARAAERSAQEQVRARDDALATVSHDLRNPLMAVRLQAERLAKPLGDSKRIACVAAIGRAVDRMSRLLGDLLIVSQIEAGRFSLERKRVDVRELLNEILVACAGAPGCEDVQVDVRVAPGAPPEARLDLLRTVQAVMNLIENALKFTPKGGRVEVMIDVEPGHLLISVSDTGVGIAPQNVAHLFERFWQANRTDRRGAGLGLNIVKGIAEAHGGTVEVQSELQKGTRFTLRLPL
jgi:signal transduction histidine kinase